MDIATEFTLLEMFRERAAAKRREEHLAQLDDITSHERKQKQERAEAKDKEFYDTLEEATHEQVAAFNARLDRYDAATVRALMDNEQALEEIRKQRQEMEASAFRLPDGRMVFKSDDGKSVLDQTGAEVSQDVIQPSEIPDNLPRFSVYAANLKDEQSRLVQRQQLHEFQRKLDEARDTAGHSDVSAATLDKLGADLERTMPDAVRKEMTGVSPVPLAATADVAAQPAPQKRQGAISANPAPF